MRRPRWWSEARPVRGALALLALLAAATAATAAAVPYQIARSDRAIVADTVGGAPSRDRDVFLQPADLSAFNGGFLAGLVGKVLRAMPPDLARAVAEADISVTGADSSELPVMGLTGSGGLRVHLNPVWLNGFQQKVRFVAGSAPTEHFVTHQGGSGEAGQTGDTVRGDVAISKSSADALSLHVGSVLHTIGTTTRGRVDIYLTVSGLYTPLDDAASADAPFWRFAPHARTLGAGSICGTDEDDGFQPDPTCAAAQAVWRLDVVVPNSGDVAVTATQRGNVGTDEEIELVVDPARARAVAPAALAAAVHSFAVGGRGLDVKTDGGQPFPMGVQTRLETLARRADDIQRQARILDYVVLGAAVAGALAAFFLMLRVVVARRSAEIVLCKARGASPRRLALRFGTQSGLVVAAGAVVGVLAATGAGVAAAGTVPAWLGALALTAVTALAAFIRVLTHPDRPVSQRHENQDSDPAARMPRLVRDIAVPVAAAAAVAILRSRGGHTEAGSVDWLAVAAPALLAFAAALIVVRAVPVLWSLPFGVARGRRGTLSFVAAALGGRRVRVLAAPLAGLVAATAAVTFAARLDSSVTQQVRDDALYAVGAGARIEAVPDTSLTALNRGAEVSLPDGLAARAAALPGVGQALSAYAGVAAVTDNTAAPASVAVLVADSTQLRALTSRAAAETGARSGRVPDWWPSPPVRPGELTALVSPGLAALAGGSATLNFGAGAVPVELVGTADLPTASVVAGEYGPGYIVLPADQMGAKAPKADALWLTGQPDADALRGLPGMKPYFPVATFAQNAAAGYSDARTDAAHAVLRMAELLSAAFGLLCLAQTMGATRSAARDSALLLRVFGMTEGRGRLLGPAITLPVLGVAVGAGLAMGATISPLLGDLVPGAPSSGWLLPVAGVVVLCAVGGVVLEVVTRGRQRLSVRLRAAEFE